MNKTLRDLAEHTPQLLLSENDRQQYKDGLRFLALIASENFLDIPQLPDIGAIQDGLFHTIPYLHGTPDWTAENEDRSRELVLQKPPLLAVCNLAGASIDCPYHFEFDYKDEWHYRIYLYDHTGDRTVKHLFIARERRNYYSEIKDSDSITLSTIESMLAPL